MSSRSVGVAVGAELERIDAPRRAAAAQELGDLRVRRLRAAARDDRVEAAHGRQRRGLARSGDAEVARQADRQARAGADQRQVADRLAEAKQVVVVDRVGDRDRDAFAAQRGEARADRRRRTRRWRDDRRGRRAAPRVRPARVGASCACSTRTRLASVIGVSGWSRMPLSGEQHVADEEVALEDRAAVVRERRRGDREVAAELVHQRLEHRADVAARRRVEGRADLEVDLRRAAALQPAARRQRLPHRDLGRRGARLERDDDGIGVDRRRVVGNADRLHDAHAGADEVVGEVGRAGEVVGDAAEPDRHRHRFGAGQLDAGEDLDHRGVVFLGEAGRRRLHEHLVRRARERQRKLGRARGVEDEAEVLDEDVDRRERRVVAGEHVRHAVLEHPAVAGAVRDDLVERRRVDAFAQAERHRLGGGGDVHAGEELVDDLHLAAVAGAVAEPVDLGGHRVQERLGHRPRRVAGRAHHRHLARRRLGGAARDRRIDVEQAHRLEAALERDRDVRVDGRAHHEDAARPHRRGGAAVLRRRRRRTARPRSAPR